MKQVDDAARELGIPWPIDKDATEDEIKTRLSRMHEHVLSSQIEKARSKPGS
jgi:hypothetical protein